MQQRYKIVFEGKTAKNADRALVKTRLAAFLKVQPARLEPAFHGKPLVLKRGLTREEAVSLGKKLAGLGALCTAKTEPGSAPPAAKPAPAKPGPQTPQPGETKKTRPQYAEKSPGSAPVAVMRLEEVNPWYLNPFVWVMVLSLLSAGLYFGWGHYKNRLRFAPQAASPHPLVAMTDPARLDQKSEYDIGPCARAGLNDFIAQLAYNDPDPDIRIRIKVWSARCLGRIGDQQAVMPLLEVFSRRRAFTDEELDTVTVAALTALRAIGAPGLPVMADALRSDNPHTRSMAAQALALMGTDQALNILLAAGNGRGVREIEAVSHALEIMIQSGKVTPDQAMDLVKNMLDHSSPAVRIRALSVLYWFDGSAPVDILSDYKDPNIKVQAQAMRTLEKIKARQDG